MTDERINLAGGGTMLLLVGLLWIGYGVVDGRDVATLAGFVAASTGLVIAGFSPKT